MENVKPRKHSDVFAIIKLSADSIATLVRGVNCTRVQLTDIEGYDRHTHPHFYGLRVTDTEGDHFV